MSRTHWMVSVFGWLALITAGCGEGSAKPYPVSGTVTFEGKAVEGATVMFIPQQGRPSMGRTDASGKYTLATAGGVGAPVGAYSVTISKQVTEGAAEGAAAMPGDANTPLSTEEIQKKSAEMMKMGQNMLNAKQKSVLPAKYGMPNGSGLSATVTTDAAKNVFDFALTP